MEQAIQAFGGTSLVVSHDRYFLDKITTRIVEMEHGKLTEYLGNYSYYKEKKLDLEAFEKEINCLPSLLARICAWRHTVPHTVTLHLIIINFSFLLLSFISLFKYSFLYPT